MSWRKLALEVAVAVVVGSGVGTIAMYLGCSPFIAGTLAGSIGFSMAEKVSHAWLS